MAILSAKNAYSIWPSVVPANQLVEMTITPETAIHLLVEGKEYGIVLIPLNTDEPCHDTPGLHIELTVVAHNGVLRFTHTFDGEQEYLIRIMETETEGRELSVYALEADLYALRPMKGELHSHSRRSDGGLDPAASQGLYREYGYEFRALTDHHRYHPAREIDAVYDGVKLGIVNVHGEEIHAPDNELHIVNAGGSASVTARYIMDEAGYRREVEEYLARVPAEIPKQYRYRYASSQWICDRIHEAGGIAILAHPYWQPPNRTYQLCDELTRILLCSGMFDAVELVNGSGVGVNRLVNLWSELRAECGLHIPVVGSSDNHGYSMIQPTSQRRIGNLFTLCFVEQASQQGLCDAIRDFRSVAVEATGEEWSREYRCYGSLRLVSYAQYLLRWYYPRLQRLSQAEGVVMRDYAIGDADKEEVEQQVARSERFRQRFFGQLPPPTIPGRVLEREKIWGGITEKKWAPTMVGDSEMLFPLK